MSDIKYIAVVDDHTMFRKGLISLINLFPGYKVLFDAANGTDFIKQLKPQHLPDILLLDIAMPEMDGYQLASWVTINYPDIPILALSTMDAETAIIKMIKHGAKGYVLKDAEPKELKQAFDDVLKDGFFYNELVSHKIIRSINLLADNRSAIGAFAKLSDRETAFLKLACSEKTYFEIAKEMFVSERTVDGYRESLFKKLNVSTRVGLVLYAIKNGLVQL
ncbi:response regulator transcription factor [Ferruginibacter albus]|uniref:response regulator transcription factor n=1 Tax=Ferruginibacter albus TaxID=2875540 RepID=UPI001CC8156C|nr:response regulator transcription factor [Ferruginibacter albus]UAY52633.1 response regulator transcription factor [Ferruginibacter albus]